MNTDAILEPCGLAFARIPAGEYDVGLSDSDVPLLAKPPQVDWVPTLNTPGRRVATDEFLITKDVLRLSHWQQIAAHPDLSHVAELVPGEHLQRIEARRTAETTVLVEPSAGEVQSKGSGARHRRIPQQPDPDPVLTLDSRAAAKVASALGASLPRWYEWEIATRGPEGWLYPWGDEIDLEKLAIEIQDYSVDEESVMGYYSYDQYVYFVHSFGAYADTSSPFGLVGLPRAGREWNLRHKGSPDAPGRCILRSISDLGAMAFMIPGLRPHTWGGGNDWYKTKKHLAFSGPVLSCYAPVTVGIRESDGAILERVLQAMSEALTALEKGDDVRALLDKRLYKEAGFRLVFR